MGLDGMCVVRVEICLTAYVKTFTEHIILNTHEVLGFSV